MYFDTKDFRCESLQNYQRLSYEELSTHIINEFNHLLDILKQAKRSVLTDSETIQRVYCLACVLWQSQNTRDLAPLMKEDVYDALLRWTLDTLPKLKSDYSLMKVAVDRVLCSMCSIKPVLYDRLLIRLGIVPGNQGCENTYTFRHVIPDPEGESPIQPSVPFDLKSVNITENMLKSLSIISLSCISTYKLIHSRFLSILIDLIVDFIVCDKSSIPIVPSSRPSGTPSGNSVFSADSTVTSPDFFESWSSYMEVPFSTLYPSLDLSPLVNQDRSSVSQSDEVDLPSSSTDSVPRSHIVNIDLVTAIMDFFAELCWQNILRTWLSSERNTILWDHLIRYLCINVPKSQTNFTYNLPSKSSMESMKKLENATINFFTKCCGGYVQNQEKLARVLKDVLSDYEIDKGMDSLGVSAFTRRIFVELIAGSGHIYVSIETGFQKGLNNIKTKDISLLLSPPAFPASKRHQLLFLNVDRTCMDILTQMTNMETDDEEEHVDGDDDNGTAYEMSWENCLPSTSKQCLQAENSVKSASKRFMDYDSIPRAKKICTAQNGHQFGKLMFWAPSMNEYININQKWTMAEILQVYVPSGDELEVPVLIFLLSEQELVQGEDVSEGHNLCPSLVLQKFVGLEGFKLLATNFVKKSKPSHKKSSTEPRSVKRGRLCTLSEIPVHTLLAFGQFQRLSEYRDNKDAKMVLELITGLGKEVDFNCDKNRHLFSQDVFKICNPLMVLPFELLRLTHSENYKTTSPNSSELGIRFAPAVDFVLTYLSVCTHQPESKNVNTFQENKTFMRAIQQCYLNKKVNKNASKSYWPKGTGYSSGHLRSDSSKTPSSLLRREEEEELVSSLLLVLGNYICPHPNMHSNAFMNYKEDIYNMLYMHHLPSSVITKIKKSCLMPIIINYLKNDSVFDMVNHIPLYEAIMFVIRALVSNVQLNSLVLTAFDGPNENPSTSSSEPESIVMLLTKLKAPIDSYLRGTRLRTNNVSSSPELPDDSDIQEQLLFANICNTADIIERIQRNYLAKQQIDSVPCSSLVPQMDIDVDMIASTMNHEMPKDYVKTMAEMQFGQCEIMTVDDDGSIRFQVPYHFQKLAQQTMVTIPARMKRLAMEMRSLATSLPISKESAIFIQHDEDRIDIIKVLITGPAGTPYMNGCFEFDIFCPSNYPSKPILVNFQTTGSGKVRFNPNLYSSGKVCLSLLNTWQGESWNPKTSSILQVLVSIQAMILVSEPYYNEPGFESNRGSKIGETASKAYNNNLLSSTIRYAMINQISSPSSCFKKVILTHFWLKRDEIKAQVNEWICQCEGSIKRTLQAEATQLFNDLDKLTLPN